MTKTRWFIGVFAVVTLLLSIQGAFASQIFFDGGEVGTPAGNGWSNGVYTSAQANTGTYSITSGGGSAINTNASMNATGYPRTLSGWYYNTAGTFQEVRFGNDVANDCTGILLYSAVVGRDKNCNPYGSGVMTYNVWTHFNITFENASHVTMIVDGVGTFSGNTVSPITDASQILVYSSPGGVLDVDDLSVDIADAPVATDSLTYSDIARSSDAANVSVNYSVLFAATNATLDSCIFSFDNGTGSFVNDSPVALSGTSAWCNVTKNITAGMNGSTIRYKWYVNSTILTNETPEYSYVPLLPEPPFISTLEKWPGNPTQYDAQGNFSYAHGLGGEMTTVVEGRYIYYLTHRQSSTGSTNYIFFTNTTDPYNLTLQQRVYDLDGRTMPYIARTGEEGRDSQRINGTFHVFVNDAAEIRHLTTNNFLNYTDYCGNTLNDIGHYNSAAYFDNDTGVWHMLVDGQSGFHTMYYNSTDGCNWTSYGYILNSTAGNADFHRFNGTFFSIYSTYTNLPANYTLALAMGTNPANLTIKTLDLLADAPYQSWETGTGSILDWSDAEWITIPNTSMQYFDKKFYMYYLGDQNRTGVAYDSLNQTTYGFFGIPEPLGPAPEVVVNYTLTVQMNDTNTSTPVNSFCADIGGSPSCTTNGTVYFLELNNGTVNLSYTSDTMKNSSVNITIDGNTTYVIQAVENDIPPPTLRFALTNVSCAQTLPNEDDSPGVAQLTVTAILQNDYTFAGFVGNMTATNSITTTGTCVVGAGNATDKNITCTAPIHFYDPSGTYATNVNVSVTPNVTSATLSCTNLQLVASQRVGSAVSFPGAVPGSVNVAGDQPVLLRNTGNKVLNVALRGYDLVGRLNSSATLGANQFYTGLSTPTTQVLHNVSVVQPFTVPVGVNGNQSLKFWVSLPSNLQVQEYSAASPWQLVMS